MTSVARMWSRVVQSWRRSSTATKILVTLDILALLLVIAFFFVISALLNQRMRAGVDADLQHHISTLRTVLAWESYYLRAEARTLVGLAGIHEALQSHDIESLSRLAKTVQESHGLDAVYVTSDTGDVLLSLAPRGPSPAAVMSLDLIQQGFQGLNSSRLFVADDKVWLAGVAPHIQEDGRIDAVFLLARELDHEYLKGVSATLGIEVVLMDERLVVSSLPPADEARLLDTGWTSILPAEDAGEAPLQDVRIGETTYRALIAPLSSEAPSSLAVGLLQPTALIEDAIQQMVRQVAILGFLLVSVPFVLIQFLMRRVFRPLQALMQAAEAIAAGNLDQPVKVQGTAEVQALATSFDQMRVHLKNYMEEQRRWNEELEAKVRTRTRELEELCRTREQLANELISAQEELKAAWAFQQSIIDGVAEPIMVVGTDYRIQLMNRAAQELAGEDNESSEPLRCYQVSHQRESPCNETQQPCPLELVRRLGHPVTVVHEHVQANGERRYFEVIASPLWAEDGTLQGIIECMRDITERKQAEETLKQYAERLRALTAQLIEVAEAERQRVARELHDETSQALANLVVTLGMIARLSDDGEIRQHLEAAKRQAVDTLEGVKRIVLDLRPRLLDDYGLQSAIRWYAEERLGRAGVHTTVEVRGSEVRLPPHAETGVFRVVQEAVNNIARHARATEAKIRLTWEFPLLRVEIEDNGCGFSVEEVMSGTRWDRSLGLLGMQERVTLIGGTLVIDSAPGMGTHILVQVPLPEVEEAYAQNSSAIGG